MSFRCRKGQTKCMDYRQMSNEYSILVIDESPPNNDAKHIQIDNGDPKIKCKNNKTQAKTIRLG